MRYHFTLVRMAIIKKSANNKCWRGYVEREPSYIVGGNVNWCIHYGEQYEDYLKNPPNSYDGPLYNQSPMSSKVYLIADDIQVQVPRLN